MNYNVSRNHLTGTDEWRPMLSYFVASDTKFTEVKNLRCSDTWSNRYFRSGAGPKSAQFRSRRVRVGMESGWNERRWSLGLLKIRVAFVWRPRKRLNYVLNFIPTATPKNRNSDFRNCGPVGPATGRKQRSNNMIFYLKFLALVFYIQKPLNS